MTFSHNETPLWWADAPFSLVQRIYHEARRAVPQSSGKAHHDPVVCRQRWLGKVSAEFHRRLRDAYIYVEGASDVDTETR